MKLQGRCCGPSSGGQGTDVWLLLQGSCSDRWPIAQRGKRERPFLSGAAWHLITSISSPPEAHARTRPDLCNPSDVSGECGNAS